MDKFIVVWVTIGVLAFGGLIYSIGHLKGRGAVCEQAKYENKWKVEEVRLCRDGGEN